MSDKVEIDPATRTEIEAAVYRKMIEHFQKYPEVQNIELMNLAYFCRNMFFQMVSLRCKRARY